MKTDTAPDSELLPRQMRRRSFRIAADTMQGLSELAGATGEHMVIHVERAIRKYVSELRADLGPVDSAMAGRVPKGRPTDAQRRAAGLIP